MLFKRKPERKRFRILYLFGLALLALFIILGFLGWRQYTHDLQPVSNNQRSQTVIINPGTSTNQIADLLHADGLIRSAWAFEWYVRAHGLRSSLQAGTYSLTPSQSAQEIAKILTQGKITTKLVTILPGKRLDQVRSELINAGFSPTSVDAALQPGQYGSQGIMAYKPAGANLEGLLYPDSFQKTSTTDPSLIVSESLTEMSQHMTPSLISAFRSEGLTPYQGITLASILEQEVSPKDASQAAQVFLKRLKLNMPLGSDVTAFYGAIVAGHDPSINYDSPYNTLLHKGLPPTPISNVDDQALAAAAHPAGTDWLYFVTADNGVTHFESTAAQHDADVAAYCQIKCTQDGQ